jgi:hypothetical protein
MRRKVSILEQAAKQEHSLVGTRSSLVERALQNILEATT